ncbi:transposase, partial [Streptomyces sp. NPDC001953]
MRALFDLLRGPASAIRAAGTRFKGLLTVAIDGTYLDVPDSPLHRARLGKSTNQYATSGYPQICLTALVACGTRAVLDAAFGPRSSGETVYGKQLMRSLHAGMIVLLDRGFSSNPFLAAVAATEAAFLARVSAVRKPPVLARFDDGSFLSRFGDPRSTTGAAGALRLSQTQDVFVVSTGGRGVVRRWRRTGPG